jgi:hypothetical protein
MIGCAKIGAARRGDILMGTSVVRAETLSAQDAEHLRLLSIFHYVVGGLQALFACFPILHLLIGAFLVFGPGLHGHSGERLPTALMGSFFMIFAGAWMLVGWTLAVCMVVAGRSLAQRRRHFFCLVVAGIEAALCMPLGTALGVLTIVVLIRPTVKQAFGA